MSWWLFPWWIVANAALGHVAWQWYARRRRAKKVASAEHRMERIARLELALGVGLYYAADWLKAQSIRASGEHMRSLANDGNGAVEVACWACDKRFRPHAEHEGFYALDDRTIHQKLCADCIANVATQLDRL